MRPETQKASAPVRERWQGFLFGRLVLCGFRRQDVPAQILLKLEGELIILLQTVEIGVGKTRKPRRVLEMRNRRLP